MLSIGTLAYKFDHIFPLKTTCAIAKLEGLLNYYRRRTVRETVQRNIVFLYRSTIVPEEADALTKQFFEYRHLRRTLLMLTPKMDYSRLVKLFPLYGVEHLDRALSLRKGVILLGSHINSVANATVQYILRKEGYDVNVISVKNPEQSSENGRQSLMELVFNKWYKQQDVIRREHVLHAQLNIRPVVRCLNKNGILLIMGDGTHSAGFVKVDFLGRSWPFPRGAMSIARLTGATVLPLFCIGKPTKDLKCVIEKSIALECSDNVEKDLKVNTAKFAQQLENHLWQNVISWELLAEHRLTDLENLWSRVNIVERYQP